ncbi:uncharacterized protein ASCRUDRAFT_76323 [Ascoidea rubescens DSM 1968]|uniref:Protein kinase domain-containing protein n=1 Tax=Ascoidea rubescens DSM 1968 TaxID=1344418 RepID=A0A1D2VFL5_9ASCO|nr:hypothetical protein ASCRUDRAFT_76323 [Ascoidea rubescens DSM 1968]ODV60310.1 hypothetical protein ASCRUDRAFT_76323 [Ascoidea rubescens DSM 1968]
MHLMHFKAVVHCNMHDDNVVYKSDTNHFFYLDFGSSSIHNLRKSKHTEDKNYLDYEDNFLTSC